MSDGKPDASFDVVKADEAYIGYADVAEFQEAHDDLFFPLTQTRVGANAKPDFDYTNLGLLFPQNDATEIAYLIVQIPHAWKEGTDIEPHIHWRQTGATLPTWKLEYVWFNNGAAVPTEWTTLTADTGVFTYASGSLAQISSFGMINGAGKTISSMLLLKLYRQDDAVTGDVLAYQFDIHFERDSLGSPQRYSKARA